jgi:16S rRNA (guanine1207-N2)-methyltransferase
MEADAALLDLLSKFSEDLSRAKTGMFLAPELSNSLVLASVIEYRADRAVLWQQRSVALLEKDDKSEPVAIILVTKDVDETLGGVGELARRGATEIILISPNDKGASRYQKIFAEHLIEPAISKFHHKILKIKVTDEIVALSSKATPTKSEEGIWGVAGTFSSHRIDYGSKLLGELLPPLRGSGADLCAGSGYLTLRALEKGAESVTMVEVDRRSLDLARINLKEAGKELMAHPVWEDILSYENASQFSWIVMNPPFHSARGVQDRQLGQQCIEKAARLLSFRSPLFLVSLTNNGYIDTLREYFSEVKVLGSDKGFSVYRASQADNRKP